MGREEGREREGGREQVREGEREREIERGREQVREGESLRDRDRLQHLSGCPRELQGVMAKTRQEGKEREREREREREGEMEVAGGQREPFRSISVSVRLSDGATGNLWHLSCSMHHSIRRRIQIKSTGN